MTELRATQRLQLHKDFTLRDAAAQVPYLAQLGISHLYASPILTARPGSQHGYDVIDPSRINPELGGEEALVRLVNILRAHDMGLILDIVPNHMAVGGDGNPWWLDVLEWGKKALMQTSSTSNGNPMTPCSAASCWCPSCAATTARRCVTARWNWCSMPSAGAFTPSTSNTACR